MESRLPNPWRPIQTNSNVLQAHKFSSHFSDDDEHHLLYWSGSRVALSVTNSFLSVCTIRHDWHLGSLACTACTGVSSRTSLLHYDLLRSTMTCSAPLWLIPLHYDSSHSTTNFLPYHDIMTCSIGYKVTPLQGYVSRVFFIHSTTIWTILFLSPLPSTSA